MSVKQEKIKLGTRGSALAMIQAHMVRGALVSAHDHLDVEIVEILTSGDWRPEQGEVPLNTKKGGKAQFAKEIEEALLSGHIDIAVHSMKDMDSRLPDGLVIEHMLPREDPRDCLIINEASGLSGDVEAWPAGTRVGTTSARRSAFLKVRNPGIQTEVFRGNVPTRLEKLKNRQVDVTLLALAGLKRMNMAHEASVILSPEEMLPCAAQGAVGIEMRAEDERVKSFLDGINCADTCRIVKTERSVLKALEASCHTPVGVYAIEENDALYVRAMTAAPDGSAEVREEMRVPLDSVDALEEAYALGLRLKERTPAAWLSV